MRYKLAVRICAMACLLAGIAASAQAQFWNKKDYQKWSAGECRKILSDSPWAQNLSFSSMQMLNGAQDTTAAAAPAGLSPGQIATPGRQPLNDISYTAQIFSALPVREAQVRLDRITMRYDRMNAAQKKAFDESAAKFLAVQFPKTIVIRVSYSTNVASWQAAIESFWQLQNTEKLRTSTYLAVGERTVQLLSYQFAPAKDQAFFLVFPRMVENEPLLDPTRTSLTLQIRSPQSQFANTFGPTGSVTAQPPAARNIILTFNPKKMMYHGKLAY